MTNTIKNAFAYKLVGVILYFFLVWEEYQSYYYFLLKIYYLMKIQK